MKKKNLNKSQKKLNKLNRSRGKRACKEIAKLLNAIRVDVLGGVDIVSDNFIVEVKDFQRFHGEKILSQVEKHLGRYPDKKCLGIVHLRGKNYENSIVLVRLKDFLEILCSKNGEKY